MVFCGRKLPDDSVLSDIEGIREHSTVHVVRRKVKRTGEVSILASALDPSSIEGLVTGFQTALMDPQHRTLVGKTCESCFVGGHL